MKRSDDDATALKALVVKKNVERRPNLGGQKKKTVEQPEIAKMTCEETVTGPQGICLF